MKTNWNLIGLVCLLIAADSLIMYVIICVIKQLEDVVKGRLDEWLTLRNVSASDLMMFDVIALAILIIMAIVWTIGNVSAIRDAR